MQAIKHLLQTKAQSYSFALLIGCLVFVIPLLFLIVTFSSQAELIITRSLGVAAALALIGVSCSQVNRQQHWLYQLKQLAFWLPLILGLALLLMLSGMIQNNIAYPSGFGIWLSASLLCALWLSSHEHKTRSANNSPASVDIDEKALFEPTLTTATHLSSIKKIEQADKLPEYLFDRGIAVEILKQEMDGTLLLKLSRDGDCAYARLTNLTSLYLNSIIATGGKTLLAENPLWDIEIAHLKGRTTSLSCEINSALSQMLEHYPAQEAERVIVRRYRAVDALLSLASAIEDESGLKTLSMGFHGGDLEISTESRFSLSNSILWQRDLTIWLSDTGCLCSESKLINEDWTVSTPDVEVTPIPLPYSSCKLADIQVQDNDAPQDHAVVLYLTFTELNNGRETENQSIKALTMTCGKEVVFGENPAPCAGLIPLKEYLKRDFTRPI